MRVLAAASAGLLLGALFFGDGSSSGRLFWIGGGAMLAAAAGGAAAFAGAVRLPRLRLEGAAFVGLLAAFVVWNGASILWSIEPDRSWDYFNRGVAYLAFAVLGVLVGGAARRAPRVAAAGLAALLAALVAWALLEKVLPSLYSDYGRRARLRSPVGYWNALALLLDVGLPLALWLASGRRRAPWLRAGGVTLAFALVVALPLTYSRGGIALGVAIAAAWVALADERLESLVGLALATAVAAPVAGLAFLLPGVTDDGQPHGVRAHDGGWFGVALLAGAAVVFALSLVLARRPPLPEERQRRLTRLAVGLGAAAVLAGAVAYAAATGPSDWSREFKNPVSRQVSQGSGRLGTLNSSNRWFWWQEAWHAFKDDPVKGTGAGTFDLTHRLLRTNELVATEPHNLPLQFMSELGIVGFLLAAGAAAAALVGLWRLLAVRDEERPARLALALAAPAYLAYSIVDFDWDFVAVTAPLFLVLGLLLAAPREAQPRRRPVSALAAALVGLAAVYSVFAPWLAARKVDDAYAAVGRERAVRLAKDAHELNPLSIDPLIAWADAEVALGDVRAAQRQYVRAVDLQPLNWRTWYELGVFELAQGDPCDAYVHLNRAYTLDSRGLPGQPGGPLDDARARVNAGACKKTP